MIKVETRLDSSHLESSHRLRPVLDAAFKARGLSTFEKRESLELSRFWNSSFFGLDQVRYFQEASAEIKARVLSACGRSLLEEAYYIEKSGMAYAAKMSLLSESVDERLLYSLFAAEEASHFRMIEEVLGEASSPRQQPFLDLLASLIENQSRVVLIFMIQVILEGWGIEHYSSLSRDCQNPSLQKILKQILADESRHHGSGLILWEKQKISSGDFQAILEIINEFFAMVRVGPQRFVNILEQELGGLSRFQKERVFIELKSEDGSRLKIDSLRKLIQKAGAFKILAALEQKNAFTPLTAFQCAQVA